MEDTADGGPLRVIRDAVTGFQWRQIHWHKLKKCHYEKAEDGTDEVTQQKSRTLERPLGLIHGNEGTS